jgi:hypothetical protein
MEDFNYKTVVISDYDIWVKTIDEYMINVRFPCKFCSRGFISKKSLYNHNLYKHHYNTNTREKQLPTTYGKPYTQDKKYFVLNGVLYIIKKEFNNTYYCKTLSIFKQTETIINTDENNSTIVEIKFNLNIENKGGNYFDKKYIKNLLTYDESIDSFSFKQVISCNYILINH